jgi:hypothetical protein
MFEMGVLASEMLAARQKDPKQAVSHSMFVPKLVVRKSCGASLASETGDPRVAQFKRSSSAGLRIAGLRVKP